MKQYGLKRWLIVVAMVVATGVSAQQLQPAKGSEAGSYAAVNLGLIPTPQRVERGQGGYVPKSKDWQRVRQEVKWVKVSSLPVERNVEQAYQLVVERRRITVRYAGEQGERNAVYTLQQLLRLYDTLPCCTITDWPAFRWRIWMDDMSRGPVPTPQYAQRQQTELEALKFNAYHYYAEHLLYQDEYPDLAPADARGIGSWASGRMTNLQLFAHAEKTLRIPFYEPLMDGRANFNPSVEATYDFIRRRVGEAMRQVESPYFIINCDETEQLGTGRARRLVDELGADEVYVRHIQRCYDIVQQEYAGLGRREPLHVVMWGDIVAKNPAMMRRLPKDMIYIMWAYEPLDSFRHLIAPFRQQGNAFWVAASTGHSATMTSTPQRYVKNIANLFRDGFRDGAEGAMLTCWDDNGEALFDNSWHAQYWAAEMAWKPLVSDDPEELRQREAQFNANFERLFYGRHDTREGRHVDELYAVGALQSHPAVADWYTSAALMEPLLNFNPSNTSTAEGERVEQVNHLVDGVAVDSAANPHAHYALHRMALTAEKARLRRAVATALDNSMMYGDCRGYAEDYLQHLFNLKREYLRLWDQESGEYERYIVCNRYDQLAREVLELDRHVFMAVVTDAENVGSPMVSLRTLYNDRPIFYTLDGSDPDSTSRRYTAPFPLEQSATVKAIAYNEFGEGVVSERYLLSHLAMDASIRLNTPYSTYKAIYSGGGVSALIDGQLGSNHTYADGHWQGYWGDSIDAIIDFGRATVVTEVSMRFMQNTFDWILSPTSVLVYASSNGVDWQQVGRGEYAMNPRETGMRLKRCVVDCGGAMGRYLRVVVPNPGPLPTWHPAPGQPSYLFADEIIVR